MYDKFIIQHMYVLSLVGICSVCVFVKHSDIINVAV